MYENMTRITTHNKNVVTNNNFSDNFVELTKFAISDNVKMHFGIDEIVNAVEIIVFLKLVEKWTGCLKLETNGEEIIISQFADGNSWTRGYDEIYRIEEHEDWSDFVTDMDGEFEKLSDEEKWNIVDIHELLEDVIEQAEQNMTDIIERK